tara:strand:- start:358 stop:603 length:246 start_codon:yes stop_codon:yes gene_type:complete
MSKKIIKGYKGIMDLDLTNVDPVYHKTIIEQHYKDIDNYKLEQAKLKPSKRYENTVGLAKEKMEYHNKMTAKRFFNPNNYN